MTLPTIDALTLKQHLQTGDAILIDILEPSEYAREHILAARLAPLSAFDRHDFDCESHKIAVFHCKSGNRTAMNAARLAAKGFAKAYMLQGGLDAWKAAGLPVHLDTSAPIDMMRQVQIAAGSMALAGAVLAFLVSPWFIALSGFVGAGLMFAGITGFCGMARILALMPWNSRYATQQ